VGRPFFSRSSRQESFRASREPELILFDIWSINSAGKLGNTIAFVLERGGIENAKREDRAWCTSYIIYRGLIGSGRVSDYVFLT
jgi:hypothetical protein